ncbi:hypothetical protein NDU88_003605 [Pleurodeles waltl]|uniref:Uncharacterized protein n=1 Tax=Pleurodeles waltl TaxID=8319 RepID=A0AAV7W2M9_PLEWA|nr:hypothetical protein NDU88_003605 [Pleurodeles waltl]
MPNSAHPAVMKEEQVEATLQQQAEAGLTLHRKKCDFYKNSVEFFRYNFSHKGLQVDPKKAATIRNTAIFHNATKVQSFLVMATYCGCFIPQLAIMAEPLLQLTRVGST